MNITVRPAIESDTEAVAAIEAACFSEPWSSKAFDDVLYREDVVFLVAEIRSDKEAETGAGEMMPEENVGTSGTSVIAGYVCMYMAADEGEITNVAVAGDSRGAGIGSALLDNLTDRAKEHGIEKIFLEVRESNAPAIALYTKYDFEQNGLRKNFYRNPTENAILMVKDLGGQKV